MRSRQNEPHRVPRDLGAITVVEVTVVVGVLAILLALMIIGSVLLGRQKTEAAIQRQMDFIASGWIEAAEAAGGCADEQGPVLHPPRVHLVTSNRRLAVVADISEPAPAGDLRARWSALHNPPGGGEAWRGWRRVSAGQTSMQNMDAADVGQSFWVESRFLTTDTASPCWVPWGHRCALPGLAAEDCDSAPATLAARSLWGCPSSAMFIVGDLWCVEVEDRWEPLADFTPGVCDPPSGAALSPAPPATWCSHSVQTRLVRIAPAGAPSTGWSPRQGWEGSRSRVVSRAVGSARPAAPPAPAAASVAWLASGQAAVRWTWPDAAERVVKIRLRWKRAARQAWGKWEEKLALPDQAAEMNVCALAANSAWDFELAAKSEGGWGATASLSLPSPASTLPTATRPPGCVISTTQHDRADTTRPTAPTGLSASVSAGPQPAVTLSWADPSDSSIISYQVAVAATGSSGLTRWRNVSPSSASTTSAAISGALTSPGSSYTFSLRAVSADGYGPSAVLENVRVMQSAAAPAGLAAASCLGAVFLEWDDPLDALVTGYEYRLQSTPAGGGASGYGHWIAISGAGASTTHASIPAVDLATAGSYDIELRATTAAHGTSQGASVSAARPATPTPAAPSGLTATRIGETVNITWTDPQNTAITGYTYKIKNTRSGASVVNWTSITASGPTTVAHAITFTGRNDNRVVMLAPTSAAGRGCPAVIPIPDAP